VNCSGVSQIQPSFVERFAVWPSLALTDAATDALRSEATRIVAAGLVETGDATVTFAFELVVDERAAEACPP
jgi:hypothetical protein